MNNKTTTIVAAAIGVLVALGVVLIVLMLTDGGDTALTVPTTTTTATTTTVATTTTAASTTTVSSSTTVTTTTAATTTTIAAFTGDLSDKTCPGGGFPDAGAVTDVRFSEHPGFTRVVFDFAGAVPACFVEQTGANTIMVVVWATGGPEAGTFDGSGELAVGLGSVASVSNGGTGAGSGEWTFIITTSTPDRPFLIKSLDSPSRLRIDIGN